MNQSDLGFYTLILIIHQISLWILGSGLLIKDIRHYESTTMRERVLKSEGIFQAMRKSLIQGRRKVWQIYCVPVFVNILMVSIKMMHVYSKVTRATCRFITFVNYQLTEKWWMEYIQALQIKFMCKSFLNPLSKRTKSAQVGSDLNISNLIKNMFLTAEVM